MHVRVHVHVLPDGKSTVKQIYIAFINLIYIFEQVSDRVLVLIYADAPQQNAVRYNTL